MIIHILLSALLFVAIPQHVMADQEHAVGFYPAPELAQIKNAIDALPLADGNRKTIIIRYLGYRCSHCVEQLTYLNSHAAGLKKLGVSVIAVSADPLRIWNVLVQKHGIDTSVFRYVADQDLAVAERIGARRIVNDSLLDLHASVVVVDGTVRMAVYSETPYMDVARIIGSVASEPEPLRVVEPRYIDRYLNGKIVVTTVAGPADGVREPIDLDFNRTPLSASDLWVVMGENSGHAMAILHNATSQKPTIRVKKDSRAYHFMWRALGISMGSNGSFATAQNGEPGGNDRDYMFMGPTLWSSDTAVFASRYQEDERKLASHLDMLHQSPWGLGIAHERDNIYWVLDAKYPGLCRYDFRDPHEVGGTDHRDGRIYRYVEATITPAQRGRPAHVCMGADSAARWVYFVDPGTAAVKRIRADAGVIGEPLVMPPSSEENVEEFKSVPQTPVDTLVSSGLVEPVGLEVVGDRLLVGDRSTGLIHIYAIGSDSVQRLGSIATGATELLGIVVGPDQKIWFVDRATARICRIDIDGGGSSLTSERSVVTGIVNDTVAFRYTNASSKPQTPTIQVRWTDARSGVASGYTTVLSGNTVAVGETLVVEAIVPALDSTSWAVCEAIEVAPDQSVALRAQTVIIPSNLRRVVVSDERNGTFDINAAVAQIGQRSSSYAMLTSDIFLEVADELPSLKTVLWNSGSFGEISPVDEAVLLSLIGRKVDIFLIADDPLVLRTEGPMAGAFFRSFGVSPLGAEVVNEDRGQRIFSGVIGDPVTAGMTLIDCQLPRLNHHRGGRYVPNMLLHPLNGAKSVMVRKGDTASGAVRFERGTFRSIVLGINASRLLDGVQRTQILDRGLAWLEEAQNPDTVQTSVSETDADAGAPQLRITGSQSNGYSWRVVDAGPGGSEHAVVELYSVAGQKLLTCFEGRLAEASGTFDTSNFASGCYFVIVRTMNRRLHSTFIIR